MLVFDLSADHIIHTGTTVYELTQQNKHVQNCIQSDLGTITYNIIITMLTTWSTAAFMSRSELLRLPPQNKKV